MMAKVQNKKSTEYTQKITSQARIAEEQLLEGLNESEVYDYMLSKLNFCQRKQMYSSLEAKVYVKVGDICFTDFGLAYLSEVGYQHFWFSVGNEEWENFCSTYEWE